MTKISAKIHHGNPPSSLFAWILPNYSPDYSNAEAGQKLTKTIRNNCYIAQESAEVKQLVELTFCNYWETLSNPHVIAVPISEFLMSVIFYDFESRFGVNKPESREVNRSNATLMSLRIKLG